jgi:formamidase
VTVSHELLLERDRSLLVAVRGGHNRLHPDIPPALVVGPGDTVTLDVRDGFDAQINRESTADDVLRLDLARGHSMTGPIAVDGAEPDDILDVKILSIVTDEYGYTAIIPRVGLLGDRFAEPFLVHWDLADGVARSPQMPGIVIHGRPFLGLVAVAPSRSFIDQVTAREQAIADAGELVMLPNPTSAVPAKGAPAREGLRTLPPRENGGNLDVRHASVGSTISLVAQVPGAMCSIGDPHFAQGDGESCGVAIETSARVTLTFGLRKTAAWRPHMPLMHFDARRPASRPCVATTGIPVDRDGRNRYLDVYSAAQAALTDLIDYLTHERGLTEQQAYVLVSVAADLQISAVVNVPNALVSAVLPLDVFDYAAQ